MGAVIYKKLKEIQSSIYFLIASNIVPLAGVLFLGWDMIHILYLYWLESCVIGFYNALKILTARTRKDFQHIYSKIFSFVFFNIHYPVMMWVLMAAGINLIARLVFNRPMEPVDVLSRTWPALVSFLISHGQSFVKNYWIGDERSRVNVNKLMLQPYMRISVMWVVLMGGLYFILKYRQPVYLIMLLIIIKTIADCAAHYRERKKFSPKDDGFSPSMGQNKF